jgi:hypothetical protein
MNDRELESRLKAVRVPVKTDEYWEDFPGRVGRQLHRSTMTKSVPRRMTPVWAWSGGLALACVTLILLLWPAFQTIVRDERTLQRQATRLPNQLHLLMADEHGMQYLVQE